MSEAPAEATADAFFAWAVPEARALQRRYHLEGWAITLKVVPDEELSPRHAAEVSVREEYRAATIYLARSLVMEADRETLRHVIDHELQHVVLHPLDALKSFVLDVTPEGLRGVVASEFARANERVRAALERLLHESAAPAQ